MRHLVRPAIIAALVAATPLVANAQSGAVAQPGDTSARHSNRLPLVEIGSFLTLLSVYDRISYPNETQDGKKVYASSFSSTWDHIVHQHWVHDQDPFNVNQFAHPYQGATMYGLTRSSGHPFWTSLAMANVGSMTWKMAGETDPPSIDDMITTGQAGSLLGESLYRMASLVLKDRKTGSPAWHSYLADAISPPTAVNRRIFGTRFRTQLADSAPATSWQLRLGATMDAVKHDITAPVTLLNRDAAIEFWMSYGLPGKANYDYDRPLDYFDFQLSALVNPSNPIENVMIRGLLKGSKTSGANARGIWGLYASYDYISPFLFRVSSTAASLGTTQQIWLSPDVAVQGSILTGVGYGAAGSTTITPATPTNAAIRDYHFGVTPQALGTMRLIVGDRASFDLAGREYYVSGLGSDDTHGSETIFRGDAGVTLRLVGGHSIGMRYVESTRSAKYNALPNKKSSEGTVTVAYSFLGANRFSAVNWR